MLSNLILITIITVNLIDISGFVTTMKKMIFKYLNKNKQYHDFNLKPFDCSYCMTHHIGTLYLIINQQLNLKYYTALLILCLMTPVVKDLTILCKDLTCNIINKAYDKWI